MRYEQPFLALYSRKHLDRGYRNLQNYSQLRYFVYIYEDNVYRIRVRHG